MEILEYANVERIDERIDEIIEGFERNIERNKKDETDFIVEEDEEMFDIESR